MPRGITQQELDSSLIQLLNYSGVTTGVANTYAVTLNPGPTAYVDFLAVTVKINIDATGASTLNVNGLGAIPIKKANGLAMTNAKAGGVYTLRYLTGNFILQGEGGSGNAQPTDVVAGKTFTNDNGEQVGVIKKVPELMVEIFDSSLAGASDVIFHEAARRVFVFVPPTTVKVYDESNLSFISDITVDSQAKNFQQYGQYIFYQVGNAIKGINTATLTVNLSISLTYTCEDYIITKDGYILAVSFYNASGYTIALQKFNAVTGASAGSVTFSGDASFYNGLKIMCDRVDSGQAFLFCTNKMTRFNPINMTAANAFAWLVYGYSTTAMPFYVKDGFCYFKLLTGGLDSNFIGKLSYATNIASSSTQLKEPSGSNSRQVGFKRIRGIPFYEYALDYINANSAVQDNWGPIDEISGRYLWNVPGGSLVNNVDISDDGYLYVISKYAFNAPAPWKAYLKKFRL